MQNETNDELSRRQLIHLGVGGVTALGTLQVVPQSALGADEKKTGWIDAHVHVWSPDTQKYPLAKGFQKSDMKPMSFTDQELFSHCRPAGVERIVLIQMSFYEYDHTYMCEVMQAHPGVFSGVALIDHSSDQLLERFDELVGQGMRGFRLHSKGDAPSWVDDPGMAKLWKRAAEKGVAVCPLINPEDISLVAALCTKFPDTTVVVDHFARVGMSGTIEQAALKQLCDLARFPKVHVKTSAYYALGKKAEPYDDLAPMIRRILDSYGPERMMWASDCPFQVQGPHTYQASISLISERCEFLSENDKKWILRDTAEKVYFS